MGATQPSRPLSRAGRAWKISPYDVWGGWHTEYNAPVERSQAGAEVGWRVEPASAVNRRRRTEDGAPYDVNRSVQQQTDVVRHPEEGASGTPPPTGCARCRFQRSREV